MIKIEVLGTNCGQCRSLLRNVEKAVEELGIEAEVIKVDSLQEIMDRNVMMAPALFVDGEPKLMGRSAGVDEIKSLLR